MYMDFDSLHMLLCASIYIQLFIYIDSSPESCLESQTSD